MLREDMQALEARRLLAFTPFGEETVVSGATPGSYDLAVAGNGRFIVAYADGTRLRAVRYNADGEQVGGVITVASFATAAVGDVSAAMDADGDAVIAYTSLEPGANLGDFRYAHVNTAGVVDDSGLLDAWDGDRTADVAVSMDPRGGFFIGELGYTAGGAYQLRFRAFDSNGVLRGPAFTAFQQTLPDSAVNDLEVAAEHDGSGAVFAYAFVDEDGDIKRVNYGRVSASALVGSIGKIQGAEVGAPSLAIHADGSFAIAYEQRLFFNAVQVDTRIDSRVQRFDASAMAVGGPISLSAWWQFSGEVVRPSIDATPDGGFVASFVRTATAIGDRSAICVRRYNAQGTSDLSGPT